MVRDIGVHTLLNFDQELFLSLMFSICIGVTPLFVDVTPLVLVVLIVLVVFNLSLCTLDSVVLVLNI